VIAPERRIAQQQGNPGTLGLPRRTTDHLDASVTGRGVGHCR